MEISVMVSAPVGQTQRVEVLLMSGVRLADGIYDESLVGSGGELVMFMKLLVVADGMLVIFADGMFVDTVELREALETLTDAIVVPVPTETETEEFTDDKILPVANALELGIGKGDRFPAELVPTEFEAVVEFMLGLGVMLGTAGTEEFAEGEILPLLPKANALELGMG
jgi:hypothetical protein